MSTGRSLIDLVDQVLDGRYRIIRPLAEGGMSAVFEAEQLNVERKVAIKVLKPEISADPDMLARFRAEARIISELRHPNTLKLFDYGSTENGMLYLVTELLSGEPLALRLKRGPLDPKETIHLLKEVLQSLREAHQRGVIHRDLKPGNLFLEEVAGQQVVKVLDFGIAKIKVKAASDPDQPSTAEGLLLGTPAYLSPEQASGHTIDARSDIYSLGAVAYHCLSGQIPFPGEPVAQIMAHVSRPITPFPELDLPTPVPDPLARLVYRWMDKKPSRRPSDANAALAEVAAVEQQLFGTGGAVPIPAQKPKSSMLGTGIALMLLAGLLIFGLRFARQQTAGIGDTGTVAGRDAATVANNPESPLSDAGFVVSSKDSDDAGDPELLMDASVENADAETPTGLRVLDRPLSGSWRSPEAVLKVLGRIEPTALDCYRRTQTDDARGRTLRLTFIVRDAGVSVQVDPGDVRARAFRKCLSLRLPNQPWPPRRDTSTASLIIGENDR